MKQRPKPEVLVLAPADPEDILFQKLVDMMVEQGIHIAADRGDRLPRRLPADLSGFKALVVDEGLPLARELPAAARARTVFYRKPKEFSWHNERPLWIWVSQLFMEHGVVRQNAHFLERNAARRDRDVILGQIETSLRVEPDWNRKYCDATLVRLQGAWAAARHYGQKDLREQVLACVHEALDLHADAPVYGPGTNAAGLFKHPIFPGLLLELWEDAGEERFRDEALAVIEPLREAKRIARDWTRGRPFLQTESLDRKPWQWALKARLFNEPGYFQSAVDVMKAGHAALFDTRSNLWAHYGIRGVRRGLPWGRGQGWALYGLVGLLENLPAGHPDRPLLQGWLDATAEGLRRTQDSATGLWHNVMGNADTRLEMSGTAKVTRFLCRAWRKNLTRQPFVPELCRRAWRGIKAHTFGHRSCTRCYGTGPGDEVSFYATIGAGGDMKSAQQAGIEYVRAFGELA